MAEITIKNKAFTIVELLAAVAIIGVLVTLIMPRYHAYKVRARRAEGTVNLGYIKSLQGIQSVEHYQYKELPLAGYKGTCDISDGSDLAALGFTPEDCSKMRYGYKVTLTGDDFEATAFGPSDADGFWVYPRCSGAGAEECGETSGDKILASNKKQPEICRDIVKYCPPSSGDGGGGGDPDDPDTDPPDTDTPDPDTDPPDTDPPEDDDPPEKTTEDCCDKDGNVVERSSGNCDTTNTYKLDPVLLTCNKAIPTDTDPTDDTDTATCKAATVSAYCCYEKTPVLKTHGICHDDSYKLTATTTACSCAPVSVDDGGDPPDDDDDDTDPPDDSDPTTCGSSHTDTYCCIDGKPYRRANQSVKTSGRPASDRYNVKWNDHTETSPKCDWTACTEEDACREASSTWNTSEGKCVHPNPRGRVLNWTWSSTKKCKGNWIEYCDSCDVSSQCCVGGHGSTSHISSAPSNLSCVSWLGTWSAGADNKGCCKCGGKGFSYDNNSMSGGCCPTGQRWDGTGCN